MEGETGGICSVHERDNVCLKMLAEKPGGKRLLGRRRLRWKDNIEMHVRELGLEGADWIYLDQDRN
jgi:hypothetical protein